MRKRPSSPPKWIGSAGYGELRLGRRLCQPGRLGLGVAMREAPFDLRALFDGQRVVKDIAGDSRGLENDQLARGNLSVDRSG